MNELEVISIMLMSRNPPTLIRQKDMQGYRKNSGSEMHEQTGGGFRYRQSWNNHDFVVDFDRYHSSLLDKNVIFEDDTGEFHKIDRYNVYYETETGIHVGVKIYLESHESHRINSFDSNIKESNLLY